MQNPELWLSVGACSIHKLPALKPSLLSSWIEWFQAELGEGDERDGCPWTKNKSVVSRPAFHSYKSVISLSSGFLTSLRSQKRKNKSYCECERLCVCVCVCVCVVLAGNRVQEKKLGGVKYSEKTKWKPFTHYLFIDVWNHFAVLDQTIRNCYIDKQKMVE